MATTPSLSKRRWSKTPVGQEPQPSSNSVSASAPLPTWKTTRQPSLRQLARKESSVSAAAASRRPHRTLTLAANKDLLQRPNLHWHLNAAAAHALTRGQTAMVYSLFRFYDSSSRGDALPSIDCARLVNIMRDAGVLCSNCSDDVTKPSTTSAAVLAPTVNTETGVGDPGELRVQTIETAFAHAVLGSMRVYLDVDEQPGLTFPAFCGALLCLAAAKFPTLAGSSPEAALHALIAKLTAIFQPSDALVAAVSSNELKESPNSNELPTEPLGLHRMNMSEGWLYHFPSDGSMAAWNMTPTVTRTYIGKPCGDMTTAYPKSGDFRSDGAFPDVIESLSSDLRVEAQLEERGTRAYLVPPELAAQFPKETLAIIIAKFRAFDVLDRGALPRIEMFALLSSLAKPLELADVHGTLAHLVKGGAVGGGEVTLLQLLETLNNIRASRRTSYGSNNRKVAAAAADAIAATTISAASIDLIAVDDPDEHQRRGGEGDNHRGKHHKTKHGHHQAASHQRQGSTTSAIHRKPHGGAAAIGKHRKSITPQMPTMDSSEPKGDVVAHNKKRVHSQHIHRISSKNALTSNTLSELSDAEDGEHRHTNGEAGTSHRRNKLTPLRLASPNEPRTSDDASSDYTASSIGAAGAGGEIPNSSRSTTSRLSDTSHPPAFGQDLALSGGLASQQQAQAGPNTMRSPNCTAVTGRKAKRSLEVTLLLGGDHDGAIVSTILLSMTTREITERTGVLVGGDDVSEQLVTPILPTQHSLSSALLMLKKRLTARIGEGFLPRHPPQVEAVNDMLLALRRQEPRYSSAKTPASSFIPFSPIERELQLANREAPKRATSPTRSPSSALAPPLSPEQLRIAKEQREALSDVEWVRALNSSVGMQPTIEFITK